MRLFIAVEIDDTARQVAEQVTQTLRLAIGPTLKAGWIPADRLHLTVRFIGNVADARVPEILAPLSQALPQAPFPIEFGEAGVFPHSGRPRVIWIGLKDGIDGLTAMNAEFNRRLTAFGIVAEDRPFSAHLTLSRIKDAPPGATALVRDAVRGARVPQVLNVVHRATIFQSHLSPKGPRYEPLAYANLVP